MSTDSQGAAAANTTATAPISFADCNNDICPYSVSFYPYEIDLAPNAAFLALFSLSLAGYLAVLALTRRSKGFTAAMTLGLASEILGYAGRVISWGNQWDEGGFLMQICCLTIGPAFLAAGIYLCIRRIVTAFGPENSRIPPQYYTRIVGYDTSLEPDIIMPACPDEIAEKTLLVKPIC